MKCFFAIVQREFLNLFIYVPLTCTQMIDKIDMMETCFIDILQAHQKLVSLTPDSRPSLHYHRKHRQMDFYLGATSYKLSNGNTVIQIEKDFSFLQKEKRIIF